MQKWLFSTELEEIYLGLTESTQCRETSWNLFRGILIS
jgi:hypothetical protein